MRLVFCSEHPHDEYPGMTVADCYCNFIVRNRLLPGDVYAAVVQRVYVTYLQHPRNVFSVNYDGVEKSKGEKPLSGYIFLL